MNRDKQPKDGGEVNPSVLPTFQQILKIIGAVR